METQEILRHDARFRYMLLRRMQEDCRYYLGNGNRYAEPLWAGDEARQIEVMKALWNSFPENEKPEWCTMEQIENYAKLMGVGVPSVRALIIPIDAYPRTTQIPTTNSLEALQKCVDGDIEPLGVLGGGITLYVNEEGLINGMRPNRALYATKEMEKAGYLSQMDYSHVAKEGELYTILFGNIVAVSYDENGELQDLTDTQVERLTDQFKDFTSGMEEVFNIRRQKKQQTQSDISLANKAQRTSDTRAGINTHSPDHEHNNTHEI